jgi:beta-glucosidase
MRAGRVLIPALRWDPARGFEGASASIEQALALGVGGFILFGGPAGAVATLASQLRTRSPAPLLIGADLERGSGQQFAGATSLPPASALGALDDLDATRRAGELTAREALAIGVDWIFAPVADLDAEPANPIVGSRAFSADPARAAAHVAAWVEGCQAAGALACAKHFPGHGRTVADSHLELPVVEAGRETLEADLEPFRAAVEAGVASIMTAHVAYPALDPARQPATRSPAIVTNLLRERLGHAGLVVTDALVMAGARGPGGPPAPGPGGEEGRAAVDALAAGCDVILCPTDPARIAETLLAATGRELPPGRLVEAIARIDDAAGRGGDHRRLRDQSGRDARGGHRADRRPAGAWGQADDREWAREIASRVLRVARGQPALAGNDVDLVTVDDDLGGPFPPPPRTALGAALGAAGVRVREATAASPARPAVVAVYADIRGWKGRPGVSGAARERTRQAAAARPDAPVVLFGHPRLASELPGAAVLAAWGGDPLMQEAAGRWLAGQPGGRHAGS